ncbi:MAG: hypothetical protein PUI29_04855, partial [Aeromonadales bacterium]|nr:hypothetical protein [Aeromonadales bacterium]
VVAFGGDEAGKVLSARLNVILHLHVRSPLNKGIGFWWNEPSPFCRPYVRLYQSCLKSQDFVEPPQGRCGVSQRGDHQPPFEALGD